MTNKEIFIDGEHWYNLVEEENTVKLYYSNASDWTHKGELIIGLENDGDGFKLIKLLTKKGRIEYDEALELYILLSAIKESKVEVVESKKLL
ncbi:MAG TPA: hypothetical protein VLA48_03460 [Nitrososphaeraceae archaeon]|nr:hypothetical protein [Nitrososphaeraceae archaeon]